MESGGELPPLPFLQKEPEFPEALRWAWEAFWELSSDRSIGMALGPIPWSSIDRYAARFGIADGDEFEQFLHFVRALDGAYRNYKSENKS